MHHRIFIMRDTIYEDAKKESAFISEKKQSEEETSRTFLEKKEQSEEVSRIFLKRKEQLVEAAKGFNLLSNVFMSVALNDIPACQHVIRIITGIPDLLVKEVRAQHRISKITAYDAILDILAEDGKGRLINVEIQRKDTIDHARRTRFYTAMIDSECLEKGKEYEEMPDVHIIYISETDLWEMGRTVYQVEKRFEGTEQVYEDGVYITYVNAEVDDGSKIAELMEYFKTSDPEDMSQGELSERIHFLKCEEGGYQEMCEVSEKIYNEGKIEGRIEGQKETAVTMKGKGYSEVEIADILKVGVNVIRQWLSEVSVVRP